MKNFKTSVSFFMALTVMSLCCVTVQASTYYCSPTGTSSASGTEVSPYDLVTAISKLKAGDVLYLMDGQYDFTSRVNINKSGADGNLITIQAVNPRQAILDFRNQPYKADTYDCVGVYITGSYLHIKGLVVRYAGKSGILLTGGGCTLENIESYGNCNTGIQLKGCAVTNIILNCDSHDNFDYEESDGGNADGFADKQYEGPGNIYRGCRAWNNSDDGWDSFQRVTEGYSPTIYENCVCYNNCPETYDMTVHPRYLSGIDAEWFESCGKNLSAYSHTGNGNGFKLGGAGTQHNAILRRCLAVYNKIKGFDQNNNSGTMELYNCTSYYNGYNYGFSVGGSYDKSSSLTVKNCISYNYRTGSDFFTGTTSLTSSYNSWNTSGISVSSADFLSLDYGTYILADRQADGSLTETPLLRLSPSSEMINAGTIITDIDYNGSAPDLGCFETGDVTYYYVSATAGANGTSSVSPSGYVEEGTEVTFTATANPGYTFSKWSNDITENPYTTTVTSDLELTASFESNMITIFSANIESTPSANVPVESGNTLDMSEYATITGGSMTFYNGYADETYNVLSSGNSYMYIGRNLHYFKIDLDKALAVGDVITYETSTNEYEICFTTTTTRSTTYATSSHTYTVTEGDGLADAKTIYIWRAAGKTTNINNLTISRDKANYVPSTDATLTDLQVDGITVDNFDAETEVYNVVLPYGSTTVPTVSATTNDENASANVTQASSVSGTATVVVTAEDGTTQKTYTVSFSVESSLALVDGSSYDISEDRTYADGITYTRSFGAKLVNKWTSACLPFSFNIADYTDQFDFAEIYAVSPLFDTDGDGELTSADDLYIVVSKKTSGYSVANKPYMIRPKVSGNVMISAYDNTLYAAEGQSITCSTTETRYTFTGTYSTVVANAENNYWYMSSGSVSHKESGSTDVGPYRWYLAMSDVYSYNNSAQNNQQFINIAVLGEDIDKATAIETVGLSRRSGNHATYTIDGTRISGSAPGIIIKNGRKMVMGISKK